MEQDRGTESAEGASVEQRSSAVGTSSELEFSSVQFSSVHLCAVNNALSVWVAVDTCHTESFSDESNSV